MKIAEDPKSLAFLIDSECSFVISSQVYSIAVFRASKDKIIKGKIKIHKTNSVLGFIVIQNKMEKRIIINSP